MHFYASIIDFLLFEWFNQAIYILFCIIDLKIVGIMFKIKIQNVENIFELKLIRR